MQANFHRHMYTVFALLLSFAGVMKAVSLGLLGECRRDAIQACNSNCGAHLETIARNRLNACYTFENQVLHAKFLTCVKPIKELSSCSFFNVTYSDSWKRASASDPHYFRCMENCTVDAFSKCTELGCDQAIHGSGSTNFESKRVDECFQSAQRHIARHSSLCIEDIWPCEETRVRDNQRSKRSKSQQNSTKIDYRRYVLKRIPQSRRKKMSAGPSNYGPLPKFVDWRKKDPPVLSPVKAQKECGSCWAFASAAALEAQVVLVYNHLQNGGVGSISAQLFVDCVNKWKGRDKESGDTCPLGEKYRRGDNGCCGGTSSDAWEFAREFGVVWESNYNYTGNYTSCKWNRLNDSSLVFRPVRHPDAYAGVLDEQAMQAAVAFVGPVVATVNGYCLPNSDGGPFPISKILTNNDNNVTYDDDNRCDPTLLNHMIVVVGYGVTADSGEKYWLIRNSWGPTWGQNGYARVLRGSNQLGIGLEGASYPLLRQGQTTLRSGGVH